MLHPTLRRATAFNSIATNVAARKGKPARRGGEGSHAMDKDPRRTLGMQAQDGRTTKQSGKKSHAAGGDPRMRGAYMVRSAGTEKGTTLKEGSEEQ